MSLSHYRIVEKIGEGGMGQVWKAVDTTLGRDVALKILPEHLSRDPERLARFEREAKLLASLNHPAIAAVYQLQNHDGMRFLAMELAPGRDLSARLADRPMAVSESLRIAKSVAEALEAAHERGIIHRDLKPSNIMVSDDDGASTVAGGSAVKVLDFGLAKALEGDAGPQASDPRLTHSPTITAMTAAHVILGTAAYMSPEQARGQGADRRSDIWSFGVVLAEMLTGRRLFDGETISDTLAAVLRSDIDWSELPAAVPTRVRLLLRRCLDRDRRRRLRDIGEARIVLEDVLADVPDLHLAAAIAGGEVVARGSAPAVAAAARPSVVPVGAAALAGLVAGALLMFVIAGNPGSGDSKDEVRKLTLPLRASVEIPPTLAAISPDGQAVAYLQAEEILVQDFDAVEPRTFTAVPGIRDLAWSPDSRHLAYMNGSELFRLDVASGASQVIAQPPEGFSSGSGAAWAEDGSIIYSRAQGDGLLQVPARGGEARALAPIDTTNETDFHDPSLIPGGGVLAVPHVKNNVFRQIVLIDKGKRKMLVDTPGQGTGVPVYSPTGHVLFQRTAPNPGIWAVPFSLARREVTGDPFLVIPGGTQPTIARDGTLAYVEGSTGSRLRLAWFDRNGVETGDLGELSIFGATSQLAISPDGRRIVVPIGESESDLWILDGERMTRSRLTFLAGNESWPVFSPDGQDVIFLHRMISEPIGRTRMLLTPADGSGRIDTLGMGVTPSMTPDGTRLVFAEVRQDLSQDIAMMSLADRKPVRLFEAPRDQFDPRVSPDGRYVAYTSNESGEFQIYLRRFPEGEGRWQVSTAGGHYPRWNGRGDRLYYLIDDQVMEVDVDLAGAPALGNPRRLFGRAPLNLALPPRSPANYAATADGQRFLTYRNVAGDRRRHGVMIVQNWQREFEERTQ